MTTLDKILSQAVLRAEAIADRVTGRSGAVLGQAAAGRGAGVVLTVVGDFSAPWATPQAEIDAINAGDQWFPATQDFEAVVNNSKVRGKGGIHLVDSTEAFIFLILEQDPKSIARIDIITHGNVATVGFQGDVVSGNVVFGDELDTGVIAGLQRNGILFKNPGKPLPWTEVTGRFRDDALLVIYGCKVGLSEAFIQELANEFKVRVQGFKHEIRYQFPPNALVGGKINRNLVAVDNKKSYRDIPIEIDKSPLP
jgi:hypothetical protein